MTARGHSPPASRRFRPYPAYKDSGVEWLGEIPAHWDVRRLKHLAALNPESLPEDTDPTREMMYVDIGGVDSLGRMIDREELTFGSAPSRARRLVRDGDVIVSTVRTYLRAIAAIRDPEPGMVVSTGFAVVRPEDALITDYAAHALRAPYFVERVVANSKGVSFPAINESEVATYEVASPPKLEQRAIAAFLDRETARIDALVAKKERLIELLQEKRTALISHAVTKGLDPTVPMKDSGIEWLGKIPARWEVKKVKRLSLVRRGASPRPIDDPIYFDEEGEYAWVRIADVTASERYLESTTQRLSALGKSKSVALESGELFVSIAATVGKPVITKIKCCIHDGFVYFVGLRENREYLYYLFSCGEPYKGLGKLGTQLNLNTDTIGDIHLPRPSGAEQQAIVQFLDRETAKIDALVAKVRDAIDRLKEFRSALISAAVTGKIDVRSEG
jgi:type I restriction enzyme S subunit